MEKPLPHIAAIEPRWHTPRELPRAAVPAGLWPWLVDEDSLTARLKSLCGGGFRVRVLRQHWERPPPGERHALAMPHAARAVVREVHLLCGATPWVYARTVIPARTARGAGRRLARLGERPLGAVLFSDRSVRRDGVEIGRIRRGHPAFAHAIHGLGEAPDEIWGRRSVFYIREQPLLVSEFFLPALLAHDR